MSNLQTDISKGTSKRFRQVLFSLVLQALLLFGSAGTLDWVWAWVFLGITSANVIVNAFLLLRKHPDIIAERGTARFTKTWDKSVAILYAVSLLVGIPLVAGFDTRFGWTGPWGLAPHMSAGVVLLLALFLASWAMFENAFFSTAVRVQEERGHTVCSAGPYRWVRHPGYLGFILQSISTPLLLGSLWALIPGVVSALSLVVRTVFEDRLLQQDLPGFTDYASRVRYRLIPFLWC